MNQEFHSIYFSCQVCVINSASNYEVILILRLSYSWPILFHINNDKDRTAYY